jgi:uncharacterized membrane protein YkoI
MESMRRASLILFTTVALAGFTAVGYADKDADRAQAALRAGAVLPLTDILRAVQKDFAGDVIAVELEREDGRWLYEVKLLSQKGAVVKLEYDASSARLLRIKGRDGESARRSQ